MGPVYDNGASFLPMAMREYDIKGKARLEKYISSKVPHFYPNFLNTAKAVCPESLEKKIKQIAVDFDLKDLPHPYQLPIERLDILSQMVRDHAKRLIYHT